MMEGLEMNEPFIYFTLQLLIPISGHLLGADINVARSAQPGQSLLTCMVRFPLVSEEFFKGKKN